MKVQDRNSENWIQKFSGKIARFEASLTGHAYAPHRHEEYAIAITTKGVQSFNYRGSLRHSLPGQAVILHPDELHDGQAGTDDPFGYRGMSIDPSQVQQVLGGRPLPFIASGIVTSGKILEVTKRLLADPYSELSLLEYEGLVYEFVEALNDYSNGKTQTYLPNYPAIKLAREYIEAHFRDTLTLDDIAEVSGYSKWQLSRDFKTLFGTSPYQYVLFLRLNRAKQQLAQGQSLIHIAYNNGFSDQSHLTRKFKQRFGITPKKWQTLLQG